MKQSFIVVSEESFNSDDESEIVYSNIDYLNALFQEYVYSSEVSEDALSSYYVNYYLAQVNNGGFSQFVYNSGWNKETIHYVREGLKLMNAEKNLALFNKSAQILDKLGSEKINEYLESEYFGENEERDILNSFNDQFYNLQEKEDLIHLNHLWLKKHDKLKVLSSEQISKQVALVAESIPDRQSRIQQALESEPRYKKIISALCKDAGQTLDKVTAGDPSNVYNGQQILAWHFLTDLGHHYMVEYNGEAFMFNGDSKEVVTKIVAGNEYGH